MSVCIQKALLSRNQVRKTLQLCIPTGMHVYACHVCNREDLTQSGTVGSHLDIQEENQNKSKNGDSLIVIGACY